MYIYIYVYICICMYTKYNKLALTDLFNALDGEKKL